MSEKYDLKLPSGVISETWPLSVTKDQARAIHEQCEAIEKQAEKRKWRDFDFVLRPAGIVRIRADGQWHGSGGQAMVIDDTAINEVCLGNLADILAQGPIVIGLQEHDAQKWFEILSHHSSEVFYPTNLRAALAAYRERKGK